MKKILHNPYKIVRMFQQEVAEYTGAKYAVSVDNCTNALFLCCVYKYNRPGREWLQSSQPNRIIIPKKTYLSVPMSIIHAGFKPVFEDRQWSGIYQLKPYPIWDAAKRFTSNMYIPGSLMCLSFHIKKHIKLGKGGMILTDDRQAVEWFKKARYQGRSEKNYHDDDIDMLGWNMYMTPQQAAHGLAIMQNYPQNVPDLGQHNGYKDLTQLTVFKGYGVVGVTTTVAPI